MNLNLLAFCSLFLLSSCVSDVHFEKLQKDFLALKKEVGLPGSEIYRKISKSTVSIHSYYGSYRANGVGFFVGDDGYIFTCKHVVNNQVGYADAVFITFEDKPKDFIKCDIIGATEDNDFAIIRPVLLKDHNKTKERILKLKNNPPTEKEKLMIPRIEKSGEYLESVYERLLSKPGVEINKYYEFGDTVYALGNPLGLINSFTKGIISSRRVGLKKFFKSKQLPDTAIQIDAAINQGNSGGPIVNNKGEVIGIASFIYGGTTNTGLSFAIPIKDAINVFDEIVENQEEFMKAFLIEKEKERRIIRTKILMKKAK